MIHATMPRRSRRGGQAGFTLVELLVVIIILGILSAVVVFAVRGSGDKGEVAARATDKRILRTALETYCARNDRYPVPDEARNLDEMGVLVADKYLSSRSTYHELKTPQGSEGEGNCNGARYVLEEVDPLSLSPGRWEPTGDMIPNPNLLPDTYSQLERVTMATTLLDGKRVLHVGPQQAQIFNSEGGLDRAGSWTLAAPLPQPANVLPSGVTLPTGKVLVRLEWYPDYKDFWYLFDPDSGPTGSWAKVPDPEAKANEIQRPVVVLNGDQCGVNCGKALTIGGQGWRSGTSLGSPRRSSELFDPTKVGTSENPWARTGDLVDSVAPAMYVQPILVPLANGKALALEGKAQVFEPTENGGKGLWRAADTGFSNLNYTNNSGSATLLADGRVLAVHKTGAAEIYDPSEDSWTPAAHCGCELWGAYKTVGLQSGAALVAATPPGVYPATAAYLYDPRRREWKRTGAHQTPQIDWLYSLLGDGRVLASGAAAAKAEVYRPGVT